MSSSSFIHFLALLNTVFISAAAKINGKFHQVGHKWTHKHIPRLKLLHLESLHKQKYTLKKINDNLLIVK